MVPFWGRCTTHVRTDFSGDWDVHWGYGILTHGQATLVFRLSDVLTGEQVETMINGLIKCDKYDSFSEDVKTKILNYRRGRAANIVALLKDSGFVATEHNALTVAAILCDAIPIRGSAAVGFALGKP